MNRVIEVAIVQMVLVFLMATIAVIVIA